VRILVSQKIRESFSLHTHPFTFDLSRIVRPSAAKTLEYIILNKQLSPNMMMQVDISSLHWQGSVPAEEYLAQRTRPRSSPNRPGAFSLIKEENPNNSMQDFTYRMELIAWSSKVEEMTTLNRVLGAQVR
jgi:hypothetical protein